MVGCLIQYKNIKSRSNELLPPAYVVRREGNVLTRVCLSIHGGVPISYNALQHYPECHGAAGRVPCQVQPEGEYPGGGGVPWWGVPCQGGTLVPWWGVPWWGIPIQGTPTRPGQDVGGGTQLGQHREYLLHGGRYASSVHAGGLSCLIEERNRLNYSQ